MTPIERAERDIVERAKTMSATSPYDGIIRECLAELGLIGAYEPRHIEAYMRLQHGTLDHLSRDAFKWDVEVAARCIEEGGKEAAEDLALSYGL